MCETMKYELIETKKIRALEYVFPNHLKNLTEMILKSGHMTSPLIITEEHDIVLDGSHRHIFLLQHGFKYAPVCYVDYNSDDIRVGTHLMHRHIIEGNKGISKEEVIRRGLTGDLFSPRTTRHFFPFRKIDNIEYPLDKLIKEKPKNVNNHIFKCSLIDEINHNKKYLKEIDEEVDEIIRYLWEIRQTKQYLSKQVELMKNERYR
jgi:hypothetical protein